MTSEDYCHCHWRF